jgi:transposase-like protein
MKNGQGGSPNYMEMLHEDGTSKVFGKTAQYRLRRGEVARMVTGTGGGYGDPYKRPEEEIAEDLRNGYITPEMAERDYGIRIDPRTGAVKNVRTRSRGEQRDSTSARDMRPSEKTEAVLSIVRGQSTPTAVALRFNVERAEVDRWVDEFLKAGEGALHGNPGGNGSEINELRSMVRDLADELSNLRRSIKDRR